MDRFFYSHIISVLIKVIFHLMGKSGCEDIHYGHNKFLWVRKIIKAKGEGNKKPPPKMEVVFKIY